MSQDKAKFDPRKETAFWLKDKSALCYARHYSSQQQRIVSGTQMVYWFSQISSYSEINGLVFGCRYYSGYS